MFCFYEIKRKNVIKLNPVSYTGSCQLMRTIGIIISDTKQYGSKVQPHPLAIAISVVLLVIVNQISVFRSHSPQVGQLPAGFSQLKSLGKPAEHKWLLSDGGGRKWYLRVRTGIANV